MSNTLVVIPARLASSRLPEKLLLSETGKSVLQHTWEAARRSRVPRDVLVAVDDARLAEEVERFGGASVMTGSACASGTDRIAEVAAARPDVEIFVNVQGDEPEIDPAAIDAVARMLEENPEAEMATVATPLRDARLLEDPGCVKVVRADSGRAIYFSRAPVPHLRDGVTPEALRREPPLFWHHVGLYAYRRAFLTWFASQPPGQLEQAERLEQLRAVEAGRPILVGRIERAAPGIDTREDYDAFVRRRRQSAD